MQYTFLFALGNECERVTSKYCEVRSASQRITRDPCPLTSQMQTKKLFPILIFMKKRQITPKQSKKSMSIFPSRDPLVFIKKYLSQLFYASLQANAMEL